MSANRLLLVVLLALVGAAFYWGAQTILQLRPGGPPGAESFAAADVNSDNRVERVEYNAFRGPPETAAEADGEEPGDGFALLDLDGDGALVLAEFGRGEVLGWDSVDGAARLFQRADTNADNKISPTELVVWIASLDPRANREAVQSVAGQAFEAFDIDSSGLLDGAEFSHLLRWFNSIESSQIGGP
jgi:Ca2+-binding EF-hand superfamily protein